MKTTNATMLHAHQHMNQKIAIFLPSMAGGGAERAMLNLAYGFTQANYPVDLVLAQATGPYLSEVHEPIRLVDLKAPRVLASVPSLARYMRQEQPAAVISALNYANVVALWARRLGGVASKVLVNEQNTVSTSIPNSRKRRQRFVIHLIKRFYPWADFIVGNSQGVADDLRHVLGLPPERIQMLYNPVITPEVRKKVKAHLDHRWLAPGQPPVVLAVGRLTKQKDFPTLLRAFAQVRQALPARLIILGEGVDRAELEVLVTQLGLQADVSLPGFVDNPYAYMRRASLYVLSSRWEGLPTVLIEALYCGRPIVATDCPSGPKEILADGRYGALVPMGDVPTLSQAMIDGLTHKIPCPPEESWQPYSVEAVVEQYLALLFNGYAQEGWAQSLEEERQHA